MIYIQYNTLQYSKVQSSPVQSSPVRMATHDDGGLLWLLPYDGVLHTGRIGATKLYDR